MSRLPRNIILQLLYVYSSVNWKQKTKVRHAKISNVSSKYKSVIIKKQQDQLKNNQTQKQFKMVVLHILKLL